MEQDGVVASQAGITQHKIPFSRSPGTDWSATVEMRDRILLERQLLLADETELPYPIYEPPEAPRMK